MNTIKNTFEILPFDAHYHIQSFLLKEEVSKLKFVSQNQHGIAHQTIYRRFEEKVKGLYPNGNVTPELLLKKVVTILRINPPKECNEFEWLNSLMVDNEKALSQKALQFLRQSKISRHDFFECYSIFEIVPSTYCSENDETHFIGPIIPYLSIEASSKEKRCKYLARSIWQKGLNGIGSISETCLFLGNSRVFRTLNQNERLNIAEDHFPYSSHFILPLSDFTYPDYAHMLHDNANELTPLRSLSFLTVNVTVSTTLGNFEVPWFLAVSLWYLGVKT